MITKPKNKKVLIGIVAAAVLLLGLIFGSITIAGNTPGRRADKYLDLGDKYLSELDYEQALVAYRQVLEIEPKNLAAYKGGLAAYAGLGDREGMVELYTNALGVIESMTENELKTVYETAVEIYLYTDAVYTDEHEAVAQALERGYDTLGGDERITRALIAEYGILAGVYIDEGNYEREQEIYRKIVEKNLENSDALSAWEQRVRERFQEYLSKNSGSGSVPESTAEPTPDPAPTPIVLQGNVTDSGEYMGLNWQVTDVGELAVTGHMEGEGLGYADVWLDAPWRQYENETIVAHMSFTGAKSLRFLFGSQDYYKTCYPVLVEVNLSGLDTSSVTDMGEMFQYCRNLGSVDVSGFDTSSVTDMNCMFAYCSSLSSVDVSSFDTSNVTNMRGMFAYCNSLSSVDVSNFDTSNVTNMRNMFSRCESLSSVDVSGFDTSNVKNMSGMFGACHSLSSVDVSGFDTSNVTDMRVMFTECRSLSSVDLSNFDTSNVTDMNWMFYGSSILQEILVGDHWVVPAQSDDMFVGCGVSEVTHK